MKNYEVKRHNPTGEDPGQVIQDEIRFGAEKGWTLLQVVNTWNEWIFIWDKGDGVERRSSEG